MTQKVLKVGDSAAVTIPKKALEELGLSVGDSVTVTVDKKKNTVTVTPSVVVDAELVDWSKGFIKEYKSALDALARK